MSKVQTLLNNKYTVLVAQLGAVALELSNTQKKYDDLLAQIAAIKAIAPDMQSIEQQVANGEVQKDNN